MRPEGSTTVPEPMRSVPRMRAEGCDSGMRAWRWTVEGSTRSMRPTAAFTGPTLDARPAGRKPGRETSATRAKRLLAGRAGRRSIPRDRVAPAGEERGHEGVLVRGLDGERGERERRGERDVVAAGARGGGAPIRGVRRVHPHRGLDQASELRVARPFLELDAERVVRRPARSGGTRQGTVAGRPLARLPD